MNEWMNEWMKYLMDLLHNLILVKISFWKEEENQNNIYYLYKVYAYDNSRYYNLHEWIRLYNNSLRGYCTSGPYFWRLCAFSQKIKQLRTKYPMDLVRNVPRNSKITVLLQLRQLLWSYSEKCAKINIFHVLSHKSITTWVSEFPVQ